MGLIDVEPCGEISSTGYMLANPGEKYLVLNPGETAGPFTVPLAAGTYEVEWFSVEGRETAAGGKLGVDTLTTARFSAPFEASGPAVLFLKKF